MFLKYNTRDSFVCVLQCNMHPASRKVQGVFELYVFFFFFQAEDGIRDLTVTGVQTCALPIYSFIGFGDALEVRLDGAGLAIGAQRHPLPASGGELLAALRAALGRAPKPPNGRGAGRGRGENSGGAGSFKKKKRQRRKLNDRAK